MCFNGAEMFAIAKLTFDTSQMCMCMGNSNMYCEYMRTSVYVCAHG